MYDLLYLKKDKMINQSQINDPRFWSRWKASGAVGNLESAIRRQSKEQYQEQYRAQLQTLGNLTSQEIDELIGFEFKGPSSVDEQVRRYFLRFKSEEPDSAAQMIAETDPILQEGIHSVDDVKTLCLTLYKHMSKFIICYEKTNYTATKDGFHTV